MENLFIQVVAWFREEDYPRFWAQDPDGLWPTFREWLKDAEAGLKELEAKGGVARRVYLDPDQLAAFAQATGAKIDSRLRADMAIRIAGERGHGAH